MIRSLSTILSCFLIAGCCDGLNFSGVAKCEEIATISLPPDDTLPPDDSRDTETLDPTEANDTDCCEMVGIRKPEASGICAVSEPPFCFACDGETPVLCQEVGCAEINAHDCCLSSEGETIACVPN